MMMAEKRFYQLNPSDNLWYEAAGEENKKEIIARLPDEKSKKIAKNLGSHLEVTNDGHVLYHGESVPGSPLVVLMDWYLRDSKNEKNAEGKPFDADLFKKLVESHLNMPKKWIRNN